MHFVFQAWQSLSEVHHPTMENIFLKKVKAEVGMSVQWCVQYTLYSVTPRSNLWSGQCIPMVNIPADLQEANLCIYSGWRKGEERLDEGTRVDRTTARRQWVLTGIGETVS